MVVYFYFFRMLVFINIFCFNYLEKDKYRCIVKRVNRLVEGVFWGILGILI